jgi:hypothetical protein
MLVTFTVATKQDICHGLSYNRLCRKFSIFVSSNISSLVGQTKAYRPISFFVRLSKTITRQSAKQYEEFLLQCCRPSVQFLQDHCCRLELSRKIGKSQTQEQQICHLQSWNDSPRLQILRRTLLWSDCFWQSNKKRYWSVCLGLSYKWRNIWRNKYAEFST